MIVEVTDLTKQFRRGKRETFTAVDRVSFSIAPGERVAFIGPNGAGKSTTLKLLTGILYPTSGSACVAGLVPWRERRRLAHEIGIVFGQRSQLWYQLHVEDSFELLGRIYGLTTAQLRARTAEVATILRIERLLAEPVKVLSLGQRMRCEIAAALLHRPKVLFLDEPTIGLDVAAKALLREHLKHVAEADETAIVLTSHDTGDIEEICSRVILVNRGRVLLDQPLDGLRAAFLARKRITLVTEDEDPRCGVAGADVISSGPHKLVLSVEGARESVDRVVSDVLARYAVRDLTIENAPLEAIIRDLYRGAS
jgi:ABC-2 type transport system ATP-binding protein